MIKENRRGTRKMSTNVILVEDHASFRTTMALFLEREEDIKVVGQAGTLAEARKLLSEDVEVAVVDLGLPDGSGSEFIKELREFNPKGVVLVLSADIDPEAEASALEAGAAGVLHKADGITEIAEAVKAAVGR
jgi:DNA-binding NarL/FixJ family response regulator